MKKSILSLLLCFLIQFSFSQSIEKISFDTKNGDYYYLQLKPQSEKIRGVLVLLPGFAENPESIFPQSKLFNVAYANGIMVVAIAEGRKLYMDEQVLTKINKGLAHLIIANPQLSKTNFVIGGFSAGGTVGMRYAEYCAEHPSETPIIPKGVFSVDSPLDLFDIWDYFQREIKKNYSEAGVGEAKFVSEIMRTEIGTPESNPKKYHELTPFNRTLDAGNEKFLKGMAVRVYEDIDVTWQLKERRRSLYDTNILNASELINRLMLMGNEKAEFITSKQPGYRSNGMRHPHSWNIVDEVECIQWILRLFSEG